MASTRSLTAMALGALVGASDDYIVVFNSSMSVARHAGHVAQLSSMSGVSVLEEYSFGSFAGYAARLEDPAMAAELRSWPEVAIVERDIPMRLKASNQCTTQSDVPSWGVARTSETTLPLDYTYKYPNGSGSDVDVYVLDTGIRVTHKEFEGRASFGYNAAKGSVDTDQDGHGTHVAGTVASKNYGICKACNLVSVKIFTDGGDCSAAIIIRGFQWVMQNLDPKKKIVINISVGGDPGETSDAMDTAVNELVASGVHVVGAAGNENTDSCTESPARAQGIVAVGATMLLGDTTDFFLGGSNFGKCVTILAPGDKIVSLGISSDNDVDIVDSGTSMASPHVAGVLAMLASDNPSMSLPQVQDLLLSAALSGKVGSVPDGTVNKLLHKPCPMTPTPTPPAPIPTPPPPSPTPAPTPIPIPVPVPSPVPVPVPVPPSPVEGDCVSQKSKGDCVGTAHGGKVCTWCDFGTWGDCMPPAWSCESGRLLV